MFQSSSLGHRIGPWIIFWIPLLLGAIIGGVAGSVLIHGLEGNTRIAVGIISLVLFLQIWRVICVTKRRESFPFAAHAFVLGILYVSIYLSIDLAFPFYSELIRTGIYFFTVIGVDITERITEGLRARQKHGTGEA
jgi:hypothetical protein